MNIVVLISGDGSNLQAIIDAVEDNTIPATITRVISNKASAFGLERAQRHHIPTTVLQKKHFANREKYDEALLACLKETQADLIVLAGFMHILSATCVQHFTGKIINIHPALLPKFRGLHTHQRALDAQENTHGSTVHLVTAELDAGQIIAQAAFPITDKDTADTLERKVKHIEHQLYPKVIALFATEQLHFDGRSLVYNHSPLPMQGLQWAFT